jgi:dCMP deaminase
MPVIHAGYEALLDRHCDADEVLLLGKSFADDYPPMKKEIRALAPEVVARYLNSVPERSAARVIERHELPDAVTADVLLVPDEQVTRMVVGEFALDARSAVTYERTFLRWDREWSLAQRPAEYDGVIAVDEFSRRMIGQAADAGSLSSDWWRQVGAVAVRDGETLYVAYNEHVPTEHAPYIDGDPRNEFRRGVNIELSTAIHAEAKIIARAARTGTPLADADLYVSTFPCPGCARLVAEAGFRRCYFAGPYSMLNGDGILRTAGVELIWVDMAEALPEQ